MRSFPEFCQEAWPEIPIFSKGGSHVATIFTTNCFRFGGRFNCGDDRVYNCSPCLAKKTLQEEMITSSFRFRATLFEKYIPISDTVARGNFFLLVFSS